ncbi:MAG: hypothetical protein ACJ749_19920 [Flavisolibacter sp.]
MTLLLKPAAAIIFLSSLLSAPPVKTATISTSPTPYKKSSQKIQAAILLDVSNSMDGLIEQAKAQLWNMVNVMGKAKCTDGDPQIEIALYEYGSPRNNVKQGYVKQISGFTTDLDMLSKNLFSLTTNGGDEYCGHVIYSSINELTWDSSPQSYKVIFIAGNEDFLQGDITYTKACGEASKKGIIVNTIYCGDRQQGIKEHWYLAGECGNGSFTNIDQDAKIEEIPTPYDSSLMVLNNKLNGTYMAYGASGTQYLMQQVEVDQLNSTANKSAALKRTKAKANPKLYRNSTWDLVDASKDDSSFIAKVDMRTLPDSLQKMSRADLSKIVNAKKQERSAIQIEIENLNLKREKFLAEERKKQATTNTATLETETEKMIRQQAKRFNMKIE